MDGEYQRKKEARALSYLKDSAVDLLISEASLSKKIYNGVLFNCQQCVEKAMKACLVLFGFLLTKEHDVTEEFKKYIIPKSDKEIKKEFKKIIGKIEDISWYYIPARYSVNKNGDVYVNEFTKKESDKSLKYTKELHELCFKFTENFINHKLSKEKKKNLKKIKLPRNKEKLVEYIKSNYKDLLKK